MAVNKLNPKVIFASTAPTQDTPAVFPNKTNGWGESRKNGGRPTIKEMNALQQETDLKILWLNENAVTPYDATIDYPNNAVTIKDGTFKILDAGVWKDFISKDVVSKLKTIPTYYTATEGVDPVTGVEDGAYFNVRSSSDELYVDEYQNVGGSAVATGNRYLSALGVQLQEKAASTIKDASGKSQQEINNGVETIADLIAVENPYQGARMYVKGYHAPTNLALAQPYKGGGVFVYNASKSSVNDGVTIFNGWERQNITELTPEMAGAVGDGVADDADAFNTTTAKAFELKIPVILDGTTYKLGKAVNLPAGQHYRDHGTKFIGKGKGATVLNFTNDSDGLYIPDAGTQTTNVTIRGMTIKSAFNSGKTAAQFKNTGVLCAGSSTTGMIYDELEINTWMRGLNALGAFYICSITGIRFGGCINPLNTGTKGTTLFIDRCFVSGGGNFDGTLTTIPYGYNIKGDYSTVGALACDWFTGTPYFFNYGGFSIGSLGIELQSLNSPLTANTAMVRFDRCRANIGNVDILRIDAVPQGAYIFNNIDSNVSINSVYTTAPSEVTVSPAIFSRTYSDGSAPVKAKTSFDEVISTCTFADYKPSSVNVDRRVGNNINGVDYLIGSQRPHIGLYKYQRQVDTIFGNGLNSAKTSLFFDIYGGSFRYTGYNGENDGRYEFTAPLLGDWGIQRRPDIHGIAAVVNLKEGASEINSILPSESAVIPLINRQLPSSPTYGAFHLNTTSKVMNTWDGSAWMEVATPTLRYSGNYNPPSIAANSVFKYELTLTGVTSSHFVQVAFSIDNSDIEIAARAGTDKVYIYFKNLSAVAVDLVSGTLKVLVKL